MGWTATRRCRSPAWNRTVNPLPRHRGAGGGIVSDDKAIDTPLQEAERQARKVATEYMYDLALHRHLPYALEDYHVKATRIGSQEPYSPGEVRYMPLLAVVVLGDEPLPAAFIKADITRERSQSLIAKQQEKDRAIWESEFSSDKPYNPEPQYYTVLEAHNYPVVILDKEAGVKREKIIVPDSSHWATRERIIAISRKYPNMKRWNAASISAHGETVSIPPLRTTAYRTMPSNGSA